MSRTRFHGFALLSSVLIVSCGDSAFGENAISVAGFGYALPGNAVSAAPGQLMVVSVAGLTEEYVLVSGSSKP